MLHTLEAGELRIADAARLQVVSEERQQTLRSGVETVDIDGRLPACPRLDRGLSAEKRRAEQLQLIRSRPVAG